MKVPAKGKAVRYSYKGSNYIGFSMGEADVDGLHISYDSDCLRFHLISPNWQEVEITPIVHVPEEGKKVLCWNGDSRPKEPAVRYSAGQLNTNNGWLCIYEYRTLSGNTFGDAITKHWEEL